MGFWGYRVFLEGNGVVGLVMVVERKICHGRIGRVWVLERVVFAEVFGFFLEVMIRFLVLDIFVFSRFVRRFVWTVKRFVVSFLISLHFAPYRKRKDILLRNNFFSFSPFFLLSMFDAQILTRNIFEIRI